MTQQKKKDQSQNKPVNPPEPDLDLESKGWPAPDKAEGERETDESED